MAALRALGNWLPAIRRKAVRLAASGARKSAPAAAQADKAILGSLARSAPAEVARAHAPVLAKRPDLLAQKYQKMAGDPFAFFRGTPALFYGDVERILGRKSASGARTALVGDVHVENFGSLVKRNGKLTFSLNDFDEAMLGPALLDLLRMASSIVVAGKAAGLGPDRTHDLVRRFARRYSKTLENAASSGTKGKGPKIRGAVKKFLKDASEADFGKWIDALAPKGKAGRAFARSSTVRQVDPRVARHLSDAYAAYLKGLPGGAAKDLAGYRIVDAVSAVSGNASIGRGRYRLLLDAPGKRPVVLEFKEQVPSVLASFLTKSPSLGSEATRVVRVARAVRHKLDPFLSTTSMPASDGLGKDGSYMVRRLYPTEHKLEVTRLDDAAAFGDFVDMAANRVARAHASGKELGGAGPAAVLGSLPPAQTLAKDLDTFGHRYAQQVERDFKAFKQALETDPLLRRAM